MRSVQALAVAALLLLPAFDVASAGEPKQGGILRVYHRDSPGSASIHEGATYSINIPFMPVFNNLVVFKQDVPQNSVDSIVPDLAESWAWSSDNKKLTFKLRQGVKWHDGKPFTSADVKCTFDMLMGKSQQKFRQNPRKSWYDQVSDVTVNGDFEASFEPEAAAAGAVVPARLRLHAGLSLPRLAGRDAHPPDRHRPVQVRRVQGQRVDQAHQESRLLQEGPAASRRHRIHHHYQPLDGDSRICLRQIRHDVPDRSVDPAAQGGQGAGAERGLRGRADQRLDQHHRQLVLPAVRQCSIFSRALALALDRKAFVQILFEGQADIGGTMLPAPGGLWAMPKEMLESIPGYGPDINANREEARKLMQKAGYGPDKRLAVKVSTRNIPVYRDPAVILIDQIKSIYIDAELDVVDTAQWFPKVARKDYALGLNLTGNAVDDPDQSFYENYSCGSERNYTNYCNKEIEKLFDQQSAETDVAKRKKLVWEIDKKLQEDVARPIIFHGRTGFVLAALRQGHHHHGEQLL